MNVHKIKVKVDGFVDAVGVPYSKVKDQSPQLLTLDPPIEDEDPAAPLIQPTPQQNPVQTLQSPFASNGPLQLYLDLNPTSLILPTPANNQVAQSGAVASSTTPHAATTTSTVSAHGVEWKWNNVEVDERTE
ncbi:hypothetical protein SARC_01428 [Sphaeroforma arctica JP610]|uniref:Uncharacterized protein n=1 Tax=Sphaeroforma arctica JP610 TaxID=667725 RepID=A0A0L0GBN0_9EUKA|nr:hypothetical protein SARC_01428 [Sphaeroforma arctica JP610]KNC86422.1 hypothetical protein SARC_01428 [Sphaeroforma arctica JP610]|eukprot:XP_014160324.1 hypothetical protein SARC_01428 [Sphaeroforma arctica JP610]